LAQSKDLFICAKDLFVEAIASWPGTKTIEIVKVLNLVRAAHNSGTQESRRHHIN